MPEVITNNLDLWSSALLTKSTAGRGSDGKLEVYGIKKLRELILELAVRGKLVPQDHNDEPASVLLNRIQVERAKLIAEGKLKIDKPLPPIAENEKPFELPKGWVWCRFGVLVNICTGKLDANAANENGQYPFFTCSQTPSKIDTFSFDTAAVLLAGNGDFNVKFYQGKFDAYQRTYVIEPVVFGLKFCYLLVLAQIEAITKNNRGSAIPYLKIGDLTEPVFALPPLPEQHRIVAKVDELMALCDQLEQQQTHSIAVHQTLVASLLGTLTRVESQQEFSAAWARIASHFDTLFTTEASIDQLKQTILQLAVMGKLVPQDPIEKLGGKLLVAPKKAERNKHKWAEPIEEQDKPFQLPPSWMWLRLGDISSLKHGYAFSSEFFTSETAPFVLTTPGNFYEKGGFRDRESKRKYYSGPVDPEFIFKPGDLIIPMTEQAAGLLGSPAFIPDDGRVYIHNQRLGKLNFSEAIAPEFAFWFFNCEFFRGELSRTCTGMKVRHTSPDRILKVPFPACPLAEQHRIVAKVDELMALCDALNARIKDAQAIQLHLADAIVEQAIC